MMTKDHFVRELERARKVFADICDAFSDKKLEGDAFCRAIYEHAATRTYALKALALIAVWSLVVHYLTEEEARQQADHIFESCPKPSRLTDLLDQSVSVAFAYDPISSTKIRASKEVAATAFHKASQKTPNNEALRLMVWKSAQDDGELMAALSRLGACLITDLYVVTPDNRAAG